jgi:AcrR family transcriptional regulator
MARSAPAPVIPAASELLPPRAATDGTLRRLQEAALVQFAERGYHGVSMRELAAATGVQASSLYAHVPSKEQLLRDLVLVAHEEHRARLRAALIETGDDPCEQLAGCVRAHVAFHVTYPLLATVANNELHALSAASEREVRLVRGEAEQLLRDIIERGVRRGVFHVADTWLATAAIGGMGIRTAVWYREQQAAARLPYAVDDVCASYVTFALRIVGASPST